MYLYRGSPVRLGRRLGHRQRDAEDRIRAELALVRRPVQLDHHRVDADLVQRIQTGHFSRDGVVHMLDGVQDAFAEIAGLVTVAQLDRFVFAG